MKYKSVFFIFLFAATMLLQYSCGLLSVQGPEAAFIEIPSLEFTHGADIPLFQHLITQTILFSIMLKHLKMAIRLNTI